MSGYFAPIRRWFLAKDPQGGKAVADALESWVKANSVGDGELTDTGVTAGTYGDATHVGQFTVTAAGRLSLASNVPIAAGVSSFNGRTGAVTLLSADVTTALGFTPFDAAGTLAILHGGTGATTASGARTNLGVAIGTDVQGYSANLTTFAAIAPSANVQSLLGAANYAAIRTQLGLTIGTDVQAFDADLSALAALASTGLIARTGAGTVAARTLTAPAAGLAVSNGDGVSGNPTLALANDLAALEGLSSTGLAARTGSDTWAQRTLTAPAAGITVSNGDGVSGNPTLALANDLSGLEGLSGTGLAVRTASDTWATRTLVAGAGISLSNAAGIAGDITVSATGSTIPTSGLVAPQGRLTLVTGTPVMTSDQTAKSHIYYTPYVGPTVPIYDGSAWGLQVLSSDLDLALDTSNHLLNNVYDAFIWDNSGTVSIGAGPAWTKSSTVTITIASPAVVTWTGHGLPEATSVVFTTTGALPTGITAGTTYFLGRSPGANTFNLATTLGNAMAGTFVNTSGSQSGTHTATNHTLDRGTGAGTTELELKNGIWTNKNSITLTNGAGVGTSVSADCATYVGSFFCTANGQTGMMFAPAAASGGSNNTMSLYNAYNRVKYQSLLLDNEGTITYTTATWRALGNSALNRMTFLDGLQQSPIYALYTITFGNATGQYRSGVNLNSTAATPTVPTSGQATIATNSCLFSSAPVLGFNYIAPMEYTNSATSSVFPSGLGGLLLIMDM